MSDNAIDLPYIERVVGKHTYRCSNLLLGKWIELECLLMKLLGMQVLDIDENNLEAYAPRILAGSSKADHESLFEILGHCLSVQNEQGGWSLMPRGKQEYWWAHFRGELAGVLGLFFEVQFRDFFAGLELLSPKDKNSRDGLAKKMTQRRKKSRSSSARQ